MPQANWMCHRSWSIAILVLCISAAVTQIILMVWRWWKTLWTLNKKSFDLIFSWQQRVWWKYLFGQSRHSGVYHSLGSNTWWSWWWWWWPPFDNYPKFLIVKILNQNTLSFLVKNAVKTLLFWKMLDLPKSHLT